MTTPKYKERSADRARRLDLSKPHIYWCAHYGEWLYSMRGMDKKAQRFCCDQDTRWTPRSHK